MSAKTHKVTVKAKALKEGETHFVSIVPKGANRLPHRILKSEEEKPMFDLGSIFRTKKAEPTVVGMFVKADTADGYERALKAEGYDAVEIRDVADQPELKLIALKSEEIDVDNSVLFNVNDGEKGILVENAGHAQKWFNDWNAGGTFLEAAAANAFMPNVSMAQDVLRMKMWDALDASETGVVPQEDLTALLDEFKSYVLGLSQQLPAHAFKLEKIQPLPEETNETGEETTSQKDEGSTSTDEANGVEADTGSAEATDIATEGNTDGGDTADTTAEVVTDTTDIVGDEGEVTETTDVSEGADTAPEQTTGQKSDQLAEILNAMSSLNTTVLGMSQKMEDVQTELSQVSDRVQKSEDNQQLLADQMGADIVTSAVNTDHSQKSEDDLDADEQGSTHNFKASNIEKY